MSEILVKLYELQKGDRFRLPSATRVYYKGYFLMHKSAWVCLHDDGSRRQKILEPSQSVVFLRHA